MTDADTSTYHRAPPPPGLTAEQRIMALFMIRAVVLDQPLYRMVAAKINNLEPTLPFGFTFDVLTYALRCCPHLRADAVDAAIRQEMMAVYAEEETPTTTGVNDVH